MSNEKETPTNHCVHVIGIGRTGGVYVEALLRTGEIEDNLVSEGSTFAGLLVDIGDDDMHTPNVYANSFKGRMAQRDIPAEKFSYGSVNLELPDEGSFTKKLDAVRAPFEAGSGSNLISKLPKGFKMPGTGEHIPRAIAKAVGAFDLYLDDKPLASALERFAQTVKDCDHSSIVFIAFGLAGGTGSGIALDVARELKKMDLGSKVKIVGVAQLSHSGDGDYENSVAQTKSIEHVDSVVNGAVADNPFSGGCFIVSSEQSWQRLSAYTSTGTKKVRQHFKQLVTNRFVSDSVMRWVVQDHSTHLARVLDSNPDGRCIMFNVAKLSHPGVQVLPGESRSTWDGVLQQWVGFIPEFSGLVDGYSADGIETHIYCARYMQSEFLSNEIKGILVSNFLGNNETNYSSYQGEFFDELTAYANIISPLVKKTDLRAYQSEERKVGKLSKEQTSLETA